MFKKPARLIERVFIHCSATDMDKSGRKLKNEIKAWHTDPKPKGNGWSDIGYHYLIDKKGELMPCRHIDKMPAAQYPHNRGTIAICVHGLDINKFSSRSMKALTTLCKEINEAYNGRISFHGHCEVNQYKTCPVLPYGKILDLDRFGRMP